MQDLIIVYITAGSADEGGRIARALVQERLAACVSRVNAVQSIYRWEGKLEESTEELLIVKTRRQLFPALEKRVRALHSYSLPEIIAAPVVEGNAEYFRWLRQQVGKPSAAVKEETIRTVREVSAGGVIYRQHAGQIEIALIHVRNRWGLPKGHVEEGERVEQAALREVREETGLEGNLEHKLGDIRYSYHDKTDSGEPIRIYKRVFFYLMSYQRGDVSDHDHESDEARWFPIDLAMSELRFATERRMVFRAGALLAEQRSSPTAADMPEQPNQRKSR